MSMKGYINLHEIMSNTGSLLTIAKAEIWNNLVQKNNCFAKHKNLEVFLHSSVSGYQDNASKKFYRNMGKYLL